MLSLETRLNKSFSFSSKGIYKSIVRKELNLLLSQIGVYRIFSMKSFRSESLGSAVVHTEMMMKKKQSFLLSLYRSSV